jgi:hypothetical protein
MRTPATHPTRLGSDFQLTDARSANMPFAAARIDRLSEPSGGCPGRATTSVRFGRAPAKSGRLFSGQRSELVHPIGIEHPKHV